MHRKLNVIMIVQTYSYLLAGLPILLLFSAEVNPQQCDPECTFELESRGAPPWEVERICCVPTYQMEPDSPFPPDGQTCYTSLGPCPLWQLGPVGDPCVCPSPYGPVPGEIGP